MKWMTLLFLCLFAVPAAAQDGPDYKKIADSLRTIASEIEKFGPLAPTQPPVVQKQMPILTPARIATLKAMQSANTVDWRRIQATADAPTAQYDDNGRAAAIVYRVTGDASYAEKSYAMLFPVVSAYANDAILNANNVRQFLCEFPLIYYWIKDGLTSDQCLAFEAAIQKWSDFALGKNQTNNNLGGFRPGDSDQTTGQLMGIAILDGLGIGPGNYVTQTSGGPTPTPVGGLTATGSNFDTARNAVNYYVTHNAKGGTWFESCEYNSNTVVILLVGWMALQDIHGVDYFPEIAAWVPDCAQSILTTFTPDLKGRVEWGDDERPGQSDYFEQMAYIACVQAACVRVGANEEASKLEDLLNKLEAMNGTAAIEGRYYFFVDHTIKPIPYYDGQGPLYNYSPGVGLYSRIDGKNLLSIFCPSRVAVDHENSYVANIMWYTGGEWALHCPITYGGIANSAVGTNAVLVSGASAMWDKGPVDCVTTPDYTYYVGTTSGNYYGPWKAGAAPVWCSELTRTVFATADAIFTCDRVNSIDPMSTVPGSAAWFYFQPDKDMFNATTAMGDGHRHQVNWHMPVIPTISGTDLLKVEWDTPGKQHVQIASYSPQGPLAGDVIDEKQFFNANTAWLAKQQVRVHPLKDRNYDTFLSVVRVNPAAGSEPIAVTAMPDVVGFTVNGKTVLFGINEAGRLIDPSKVSLKGNVYMVGCKGDSPVVAQ